jgi:hypothetical protein
VRYVAKLKILKKTEACIRHITGWGDVEFDRFEQVLHFSLIGLLPTAILGPVGISYSMWREFKKQWPPGKPYYSLDDDGVKEVVVTQMDRVEDLRRDLIFTLSGCIVGCIVHFAWLHVLIVKLTTGV